jgi:hypothetical protein
MQATSVDALRRIPQHRKLGSFRKNASRRAQHRCNLRQQRRMGLCEPTDSAAASGMDA